MADPPLLFRIMGPLFLDWFSQLIRFLPPLIVVSFFFCYQPKFYLEL